MVQFRITPLNGKRIPHTDKNVVFWVIDFFAVTLKKWIFLKSFYTEERAHSFIADIKDLIRKGDYSCLKVSKL